MRARLGELLIEAGLVSEEYIADALRVQVLWGGRLGTILSERGLIDLDTLSRLLGWQHDLPAALAKHFAQADRELQVTLPAELADRHGCIPLLRVGKRVVIATIEPLEAPTTEQIARALDIEPAHVIASVAAELRVRYQLEHVYGISRPHRFQRARDTELPARPPPPAVPLELTEEDLLDAVFPTDPRPPPPPPSRGDRERRTYVTTLDEVPAATPPRRVVHGVSDGVPVLAPPTATSGSAVLHALRCAIDRTDVAELAVTAVAELVSASLAAALLVVRGAVATSWKTFSRFAPRLEPLALALDRPGLARTVMRGGRSVRAFAEDLTDDDYRLLTALGTDRGDLLLAPIKAGDTVSAFLIVVVAPGADVTGIDAIAEAAGAAFGRLMRDASDATSRPVG